MKLKTKIGVCLLMGMTALCVVISNSGCGDSNFHSAAICAIIRTSKLNGLADLEDFTSLLGQAGLTVVRI